MEKLSERLTNLNKVSRSILKYGLLVVLIAFIISNVLLKNAVSISEVNVVREFICANVEAFCEVIIGAIMFDVLIVKDSNGDK